MNAFWGNLAVGHSFQTSVFLSEALMSSLSVLYQTEIQSLLLNQMENQLCYYLFIELVCEQLGLSKSWLKK